MSPTASSLHILFQDQLPSELACPICEQALRAPVRTSCGHDYCSECCQLEMTCVVCNTTVEQADKNNEKRRVVQLLLVYCPFREANCEWGGPLKLLQAHLAECTKKSEPCPICGKTVEKQDLEKHAKECQVLTCEYCNCLVKISAFERHLQKCGKVLVSCICGLTNIARDEMEVHRLNCFNDGQVCPFAELGCTFVADEKKAIQKHLTAEPVRHLVLLCDEATAIKRYFESASSELDDVQRKHDELGVRTKICERMYGPQLVWKIEDVQTRLNEAKSGSKSIIFSPAFVSHRHGYKMVASANLFGDGPSRGEFMSVYVALIRGEFDPVLEWPFKMTVRFTLLDQNPESDDRVNVSFSVDARTLTYRSAHFLGQPIGGRNAAFGAQRFCTLEKLQEYVKEDTMFLQIEVDDCSEISVRPSFRDAIMFNEEVDDALMMM